MYTLTENDAIKIAAYQRGTLLAGSIAFIGSYVYMLGRLLDRINNNDIYPISYYYYIARFVIAALIAVVLRHVFALFSIENAAILLVAFAIRFAPDQFITAMLRRAFQIIKIRGNEKEIKEEFLPPNMSLLMIEGLTRDKIDHLNEVGIDNAQVLAEQNPFMIWPRLPYSLTLIIDWIAQAQLYLFAQEKGTQALRQRGISTIYDLFIALEDKTAAPEIATSAGLLPSAIDAYIAALRVNPSFARLKEVREKLAAPAATAAPPPAQGPAKPPAPPAPREPVPADGLPAG
jgi:hypothetical protein